MVLVWSGLSSKVLHHFSPLPKLLSQSVLSGLPFSTTPYTCPGLYSVLPSPFPAPLKLVPVSPLQASSLPFNPALPIAGISRNDMLIHFVLALGALKPSDFMGLHKLATAAAQ